MSTEVNPSTQYFNHKHRIVEVNVELQKAKKKDHLLKRTFKIESSLVQANMSIEDIVNGINNGDENEEFTATHAVTILTRNFYPVIDILINANVVPKLVEFLSRDNNPDLQLESAWALANIASGTYDDSDQIEAVVSAGAVAGFISLLGSPHPVLVEIAVWTLGNIARYKLKLTNHVIEQGIIEPLLIFINKPDTSATLLRSVTSTLSKMCQSIIYDHAIWYMEEGPTFPGLQQLLPALAHLIQNNDGEILADTCEALAGIVFECNEQRAQEVADAGVLPRLVALLDRHEVAIIIPALHTINEIVSASDQATKVIISAGVVAKLTSLLEKEDHFSCRPLFTCVSGIVCCLCRRYLNPTVPTVRQLLRALFLQSTIYKNDEYVLASACRALCTLLKATEPKTIVVVLDGLALILEASEEMGDLEKVSLHVKKRGGLDCIKALKSNDNVEIHHKSLAILERYFPTDLSKDVPS